MKLHHICLAVVMPLPLALAAPPSPATNQPKLFGPGVRLAESIRISPAPLLNLEFGLHQLSVHSSASVLNFSGISSVLLSPNPFALPVRTSPRSPISGAPLARPLTGPPVSNWLRKAMAATSPPDLALGQLHAPATTDETGHGIPTHWLAAIGITLAIIGTAVMAAGWH